MNAPLSETLRHCRFEVLPLKGVFERAMGAPEGSTVTVTASQRKGIEPTVDLAVRLANAGMHAVPHLAARLFIDSDHLARSLERMRAAGIDEAFVVGGDAPEPWGTFPDALSLLTEMTALRMRPARIGVGAYPESHPLIPDRIAAAALSQKSEYADYLVTQMCFAPVTIATWIADVRLRGIQLPVYVGVPGAIDAAKLAKVAVKIGIGESLKFLHKQHGMLGTVFSRYSPDSIVGPLAPRLPELGVAGWHLFTFNDVVKTLEWRDRAAARATSEALT
jgi:methylenetetrahydrofolate reductase (NADPH)